MLLFVVRFWREQHIEELLLNITLFVLRDCGGQCREGLILNVTVCCEVLGRAIYSGNCAE